MSSLLYNRTLGLFNSKAFADNNLNEGHMVDYFAFRVENVLGTGEYAGPQDFLLFAQCFQRDASFKSIV